MFKPPREPEAFVCGEQNERLVSFSHDTAVGLSSCIYIILLTQHNVATAVYFDMRQTKVEMA